MAIVMLMLGITLGVVIYFTGQNMETQSLSMMRSVLGSPFPQGNPERPPKESRLPHLKVLLNSQGELAGVTGELFDDLDEEYIQNIVDAAQATDEKTGKLEAYHLRYLKDNSPRGYTIIFSDTTTEDTTMRNLFYICLGIYFVSTAVFLGISILLSQWATKPVETAWDQQRQFVADASHELKTPLSVIMANAELLQNKNTGEADRQKYSQNILSMSYQMRSLVKNMLDMARVDHGIWKQNLTELDFSQLVTDAVLSFQLLYEEQGLGLQRTVSEGISLHGSEQHLYQVLDVLLDNALKYSTPNGTVRVELKHNARSCVLSVASPGDPISDEDLKNIFKRFYRVDKARAINGSYGLGLSIAESVVEAHQGKIWAESSGGQNTFFVQLPLH